MHDEEINEELIPGLLRRILGLRKKDEPLNLDKLKTVAEVLHEFADRASGEAKKELRFAARTVERAIRMT